MEPQATHPEDDKQTFQLEARAHALGYASSSVAPIIAGLEERLDHGLHRDVHSIDINKLSQLVLYAVDRAGGSAEQVFRKARMEGFHHLDCDDPQWRRLDGAPLAYHVIAKIAPVLFRLQLARYENEPELLAQDIKEERKLRAEFGDGNDNDDDDAGIKGHDETVRVNEAGRLESAVIVREPEPLLRGGVENAALAEVVKGEPAINPALNDLAREANSGALRAVKKTKPGETA